MALTENLDLFLADFGVACSSGGITGVGILDMPTQVIADGMVLTTDYKLTCKSSQFGDLVYGAGMVVDGVGYQVREVMLVDDGVFCEISLQKLAAGQSVAGSQVASMTLGDLADVSLSDPQEGDALVYDGNEWVNAETYSIETQNP